MPPIRSIRIGPTSLDVDDGVQGKRSFPWANLPDNPRTIAAAETAITAWLRQSADGHYQVAAHVFSVDPVHVTVATADLDATIPANWWEE